MALLMGVAATKCTITLQRNEQQNIILDYVGHEGLPLLVVLGETCVGALAAFHPDIAQSQSNMDFCFYM